MTEQLWICPDHKTCKIECTHKKPHYKYFGCNESPDNCPPCIPVHEVRGDGLTDDTASIQNHLREKDMFKVGDEVKVLSTAGGAPSRTLYNVGKIVSFHEGGATVKFPNESTKWSYYLKNLELIKEAPMPKYKVVKSCNMITMETYFGQCPDYGKAMIDWINMGYKLYQEIEIKDLVSVAEKHNGLGQLIREGFIKEVEEEVFYKRGDKFDLSGCIYTLVTFNNSTKGLLVGENWNAYSGEFQIPGATFIPKDIIKKAFHNQKFTKIEG